MTEFALNHNIHTITELILYTILSIELTDTEFRQYIKKNLQNISWKLVSRETNKQKMGEMCRTVQQLTDKTTLQTSLTNIEGTHYKNQDKTIQLRYLNFVKNLLLT